MGRGVRVIEIEQLGWEWLGMSAWGVRGLDMGIAVALILWEDCIALWISYTLLFQAEG